MFKYITIDSGAFTQGLVAFIITSFIFFTIMMIAWKMDKSKAARRSELPLSDDTGFDNHTTSHTPKS